jgi:hypothetical protein
MEDKFNPFQNSLNKKEEYNSLLMDEAIATINAVLGELTQSNISKVTKKVDPKKKGITAGGISRNPKHRNKVNIAILEREKNINKLSPKDIENLEISEMHGQLFSLRMEVEKFKQENLALKQEVKQGEPKKQEDIYLNVQPELISDHTYLKDYAETLNSLIEYLLKSPLVIEDSENNIIDTLTGEIILSGEKVRKFSAEF